MGAFFDLPPPLIEPINIRLIVLLDCLYSMMTSLNVFCLLVYNCIQSVFSMTLVKLFMSMGRYCVLVTLSSAIWIVSRILEDSKILIEWIKKGRERDKRNCSFVLSSTKVSSSFELFPLLYSCPQF